MYNSRKHNGILNIEISIYEYTVYCNIIILNVCTVKDISKKPACYALQYEKKNLVEKDRHLARS